MLAYGPAGETRRAGLSLGSGRMSLGFRFAPARPPGLSGSLMVATSQPSATEAGLRMLREGGNAADAVLAAAAVLCVSEPMSTGIGGDLFAIVWRDGEAEGIDAAGPAPAGAPAGAEPDPDGPRSVNAPGAVAGWELLAERYGRLGLEACLADAIALAREGFVVGARCADQWQSAPVLPDGYAPPPRHGARWPLPELGATLATVAAGGADAFYRGPAADAICTASWLEQADLDAVRARVVRPLEVTYREHRVLELPPPTQGVAALEGLALLERTDGTLADQIVCCQLALEDAREAVRDGADVAHLLHPTALDRRFVDRPVPVAEPPGGTVYLCAVDEDGMAVSLVQSLFLRFGSGVVAPGTGVVLNNRAACFSGVGGIEPGRRPYHTIIPGLLAKGTELAGPFGVMGGFIQAQAHVRVLHALLAEGLDPQAALDLPRFRLDGPRVLLEEGLWPLEAELRGEGFEPVLETDVTLFGGGQIILRTPEGTLIGGSDSRKDGYAAGW
jgi:gamma-glutamyltranspeptidase / glutathione hydrolase